MKKISDFLSKNFLFFEVKISIYLNRRVFVMAITLKSGIRNLYTKPIEKFPFSEAKHGCS